jgi:TfoX/Sxy family transcriptional regulator of competence genes
MEKKTWRKSSPELIAIFESLAPGDPAVQERKMFGWPARFINGNMFAGLHEESMILRLSEEDRRAFLALKSAAIFESMPGRPMREYVVVPTAMLQKKAELEKWAAKALTYGSSLPPKAARKKKGR